MIKMEPQLLTVIAVLRAPIILPRGVCACASINDAFRGALRETKMVIQTDVDSITAPTGLA